MRRVLLAAPLLLTVSGCTPPPVYVANGPEGAFVAVSSRCENEAMGKFPPFSLGEPGYFPNQLTHCVPTAGGTNCTTINPGYLPQVRSAADENEQPRENAYGQCMITAGWRPAWGPNVTVWSPPAPKMSVASLSKAMDACESSLGPRRRGMSHGKFDECVAKRTQEREGS